MKITDFEIDICRENVFALMDCAEENPIFNEVMDAYNALLPVAYEKLSPVALLAFGELPEMDCEVLYCVISVGEGISRLSADLFDQGEYLKGMLADRIGDDYLFQLDHHTMPHIKKMCRQRGCGISRRLEAPQDIGIEVQKTALAITQGERLANIRILDSYMYDPVKTTCQIYLLSEDTTQFDIEHDCARCSNTDCSMRQDSYIKR